MPARVNAVVMFSTVVFPLPVDIITPFLKHPEVLEDIAGALTERH